LGAGDQQRGLRSPDLTPLDFFLWGYMKNIIYTRPIETEAELRLRIMKAAETIRNILGVFERTWQSFLRRCQSYIDVRGRNFEHLL